MPSSKRTPDILRLYKILRSIYRDVRDLIIYRDVRYLIKTFAPANVVFSYIAGRVKNKQLTRPYRQAQHDFRSLSTSLTLSKDWFTEHIPYWLSAFDECHLTANKETKVLEIGSWEGLSSYFILYSLPNATLTCVDTWEGADEHKSGYDATKDILNNIERSFDKNLSTFKDRFIKYKGTSFSFYHANPNRNIFDVIYIDGSHHFDDVLIDAIKCFEMLKVGGIMIFDDYFWRYYPKDTDNPAAAINVFLKLKKGSYKITRLYWQIIIEKTNV